MDLPGKPESCWVANAPATTYPRFEGSDRADVAVVGGGIVGLTTACLLVTAGYTVTVLEALKVGQQVTGRSTAKVTSQHTLIYADLIERLGLERARLYGEANHSAAEFIAGCVRNLDIECEFERKDAYAYADRAQSRDAIEAEAEAARTLGFAADVLDTAPLPFRTEGALRFTNQGQFNPAQYLVALARAISEAGGKIFENTRVDDVSRQRGGRWQVEAARSHLTAERVVIATNIPMWGPIQFDMRLRPRCHTVMAFRTDSPSVVDGIFIGVDEPSHSIRMGRDAEGPLLIVLGPSFVTGHDGDVARRFRALETWVRDHFSVREVAWRWVNEDYDSPDRVPYAGELSGKGSGMYVGTGFNGWGISNGTAAAMLIADQIQEVKNPWRALYKPTRRAPKNFNRGGDSQSIVDAIGSIAPGEGGVLEHRRQKLAVWKDESGTPRALSASCTHLGCTVTWNNADRTWDCPCHGSMFTCDGRVIHGPATKPLEPARLPKNA